MFGALGDLAGLMGKAKEIRAKMETMQQEMARRVYEAEAGGGAVAAKVSGKMELVGLTIRADAVDVNDLGTLEEFIKSAVNAAGRKAGEAMQAEIAQATAGLPLGGLANMFGMKPPGE